MVYQYFVAVDRTGHAGLAATKQSAVESTAAEHGDQVIAVEAPNAYLARRQACALWQARGGETVH